MSPLPPSGTGFNPMPKPDYRKMKARRKREERQKDREYQTFPPGTMCAVPGCPNPPGGHHRIKRRFKQYRWDPEFRLPLCWIPHHKEIEEMGEGRFCEKYGLQLPDLPERFRRG